jgi:O-antigen/teichoic acid export membrane protein
MTDPAGSGDHRTVLAGTVANVIGLVAGVAAAFAVQVLLGRALPVGGLGLVTVAVQVAFVASAGGRFGMDMTAIRQVAIGTGEGQTERLRSLVDRASAVAGLAGAVLAIVVAVAAAATPAYRDLIRVGAISIPLIGFANVYLGATRGLKLMRPTLWVFWIGQPLAWIALAALALSAGGGSRSVVVAYDLSWLLALVAARTWWRSLSAGMGETPASRADLRAAIAYGLPRAPSALLGQALFWGDLFVLGHFASGRPLDAYAAAGRISQLLLLFLTSVSLIFSPFAADLHARGETERLDRLFKDATRWAVTATLPVLIVLFVGAGQVLSAFGHGFGSGATPLRIMLAGQAVNVATGSVATVLIMVGRTGLDLADNLVANISLIGLTAVLASGHGARGAAIASAVSLAGVNLVRMAQVVRVVGISPFSADHLRLALPAGGALAVALACHMAMSGQPWWASLALTALTGTTAYAVLLLPALPASERSAVRRRVYGSGRVSP